MLEIKLFGPGELKFDGRALAGFPNQAPYLLLCYLILNRGRPQCRERLAAVFWGDSTAAAARKMLRNTLWRARQGLAALAMTAERYFHLEEDSICFLDAQPAWLDVEIFENSAQPVQDIPGQALTRQQAGDLEAAAALYTGDLLEGVYDDWCLYDRERFRLMHLNLLSKLMVFHGKCGSREQGILYGIRLLAIDKTWEKIHRQLMWLYWLAGDVGSALAQYKLCRQILWEELGVHPMPETRALYEQMLHHQFDPNSWLDGDAAPPEAAPRPASGEITQAASRLYGEVHKLHEIIEAARSESALIEKLIDDALNL